MRSVSQKDIQTGIQVENKGYIAVDLDGTLAHEDQWVGPGVIGHPIPEMVRRVKQWLAAGEDVRIFTARLAHDPQGVEKTAIHYWTQKHIGQALPSTCCKDMHMKQLWDNRAVQVETNTGRPVVRGY